MVFYAGQSRELAKMFWREGAERVEKDLPYNENKGLPEGILSKTGVSRRWISIESRHPKKYRFPFGSGGK